MSASDSGNGNGHADGDDAFWEALTEQASRAQSTTEVRTALVRVLERVRVVVATQQRFLARYASDRSEDDARHGAILAEFARLSTALRAVLGAEVRVKALEDAARMADDQRMLVLRAQLSTQERLAASSPAPFDPESTQQRQIVSLRGAIDELEREQVKRERHAARLEEQLDVEREARRSASNEDVAKRAERRAWPRRVRELVIGAVVGGVVTAGVALGVWRIQQSYSAAPPAPAEHRR